MPSSTHRSLSSVLQLRYLGLPLMNDNIPLILDMSVYTPTTPPSDPLDFTTDIPTLMALA